MADDPDPPRKFYQLKPTEFERVNPPPAPPLEPSPSATPPPATPNEGIDVRDLARTAAAGAPLLQGTNAPANRPNDVHAMLQHNLDVANAAGLNKVTLPPKRPSRRLRDYLLAIAVGNALLAAATVVQPVFGGAGLVLYNVGLPWVMFVVMDDY